MELVDRVHQVLKDNDCGSWTRPASGLYPHQWLWDSCFIAIGLSHVDWPRACQEILSLKEGQWKNGMIPHIRFSEDQTLDYFPDWRWWQTEGVSGRNAKTTGITQPPIIADAVLRVYENAPPRNEGIKFLEKTYSFIKKFHYWIKEKRDPLDTGLFFTCHPDETGLDNLPVWDKILNSIPQEKISPSVAELADKKLETDHYVSKDQRPNREFYLRNYYLIEKYREWDYDLKKIFNHSPFVVYDCLMNTVWSKSNNALAKIAGLLGEKEDERMFVNWANQTKEAMNEKLWDEENGLYFDLDIREDRLIKTKSFVSLLPLYANIPSKKQAKSLVEEHLLNKNEFYAPHPIPTTPPTEKSFDPINYWRGPVWINVNWFIIEGLRNYGFNEEAETLKQKTISLIENAGFREYFNPNTGEGLGGKDFSWSAALAIDLIRT
ncbi:MAG: trehalase family glycosidase [Candidatus Altiarchaeota archaeon]